MFRRHGQKLSWVFLVCDLVATAGSWLAAYDLRFRCWHSQFGVPELALVLSALPLVLLLAAVAYRACGLYEVHRLRQMPHEMGVVCQASGLLLLLCVATTFFRRDAYESRLALLLFLPLNVVFLTLTRRVVWRGIKQLRQQGWNHGKALIVGCGRTGRKVARLLRDHHWTGLEIIGFVDHPPRVACTLAPHLGLIHELPRLVKRHDIDHVFVALPLSRYDELDSIYRLLGTLLVEVQLVPDVPSLAGLHLRSYEIDDVAFLSLRGSPQFGWQNLGKRALDLVGGSIALLLFGPLMLAIAALIKATSPGPVLYRQQRMGLGGKPFWMLKFRSMRVDAESHSGPVWARRDDDRCTPIGKWLRRWSLDELPQLFNVLQGAMSLVGPRPERQWFIEKFQHQYPGYFQRHQVKAGMTGWAQVNGWRGDTSSRRRLEHDLYYIHHWSLWLDLKILGLTCWAGFRHKNAH